MIIPLCIVWGARWSHGLVPLSFLVLFGYFMWFSMLLLCSRLHIQQKKKKRKKQNEIKTKIVQTKRDQKKKPNSSSFPYGLASYSAHSAATPFEQSVHENFITVSQKFIYNPLGRLNLFIYLCAHFVRVAIVVSLYNLNKIHSVGIIVLNSSSWFWLNQMTINIRFRMYSVQFLLYVLPLNHRCLLEWK